jgi:ankyrin repeat protein
MKYRNNSMNIFHITALYNNFNIICKNIEFEYINLKDSYGWSPLYCAVRESNSDSI